MNKKLENLRWLVENLPNINKSKSFLITELEQLKSAFDELDSAYVDLLEQNKRYREALEFYADEKHVAYCFYGNKNNDLVNDYGEVAREALEGK